MDPKRIYLRIRLNKIEESIVYNQALIIKHLHKHGIQAELKQGYVQSGKDVCWHCWAEHEYTKYDYIAYILNNIIYYTSIPENHKEQTHDMIDTNKKLFELYHTDQKEFWKNAPKKIREFKV
jgi:hypothetical protein